MTRLRPLAALTVTLASVALAAGPTQARVLGPDAPGVRDARATAPVTRTFGAPLPVDYAGPAKQLVVVTGDCATCTDATLQAFEITSPGRGYPVTRPIRAKVGERGLGAAYEGSRLTPMGTFDLPEAFGRQPDPGTALPYFVATRYDYWSDRSDATYNTHVRSTGVPAGESLWGAGSVYDYAVVMGVNPQRVPGGGSGFFIHVTDGRPTLGCVAIPTADVRALVQWLDPAARPQIVVTL